jgi:hypothetical protein
MTVAARGRSPLCGQGLVEFAITIPLIMLVLCGLLGSSVLFYQKSALHEGATAGARMAAIESSLALPSGGAYCESGLPISIEQAVAQATPLLAVNSAPLCASSSNASQLTQPSAPAKAGIVVTAVPDISAPTSVTVVVTLPLQGVAPPLTSTYRISATSTVPV